MLPSTGKLYFSVKVRFMSADDNLVAMLTNKAIPTDENCPIKVRDVSPTHSWEYDTITYTSLWPDGQALPLTLRSYRSNLTCWQTHSPQKVAAVWAVLRRLRLDSFPAPRPLAKGKLGQTEYLIWQMLPGKRLLPASPGAMDMAQEIIPQLAELLARLHALDHNGLNDAPLYQATVAGTLVRMLLWSREMGNATLRQMIARLKPEVAKIQSRPHRLIHGNPQLHHVTVHEGKLIGLLNWEQAAIGDPRWDVMTAAHGLRKYSPALADQLVNWYETFTGKRIDNRPFWYALVSVRLWALKSWVQYAAQAKKISSQSADWTIDLPDVEAMAGQDLHEAGL